MSGTTTAAQSRWCGAPAAPSWLEKQAQAPSHRRSSSSSSAAAAQVCAACKYQRQKCAADCLLAPYFSHEQQRQFLNAHRLFGVSNIVNFVRRLDPPAKDAAMRTIVFQSEARAANPAGGCHRIIQDLERQINLATAELQIVLHHLALCRAAAAAANANADIWRENDGEDDINELGGLGLFFEPGGGRGGAAPPRLCRRRGAAHSAGSRLPRGRHIRIPVAGK